MIQIGFAAVLIVLVMIAYGLTYQIKQAEKRIAERLEKLIDILIKQKE